MKTSQFKFILFVSLILSVMGIVTEVYDYFQNVDFNPDKQQGVLTFFLWIFKSLYVYMGLSHTALNVYNLIFYILLLFGAIFFYVSKGKEQRLIRFFFSVLLISNIFILIRIVLTNTILDFGLDIKPEHQMKRYFFKIGGFIFCLCYSYLGCKMLKMTSEDRELEIEKKENSKNVIITEATKSERLLHWVIDNVIVMFMLFSVFEIVYNYQMFKGIKIIPDYLNNRFGFFVFVFLIRFIYYPFFEKIFGATPGKFLTNSRVVNQKTEIPEMGSVLERTLYRHIPFEIFSFLGRKGWHDSISKTFVVKEKQEGLKSFYIVWIFVICFVIFCFYLYKFIYKF